VVLLAYRAAFFLKLEEFFILFFGYSILPE
jgi:hypothetical protein